MRNNGSKRVRSWLLAAVLCGLGACNEESVTAPVVTDADLQAQIAALLAQQSDLPPDLQVTVSAGQVTVGGSLQCEDCAGWETPGTAGSVQQSVGAVVRAVPGVVDVQFAFVTPP